MVPVVAVFVFLRRDASALALLRCPFYSSEGVGQFEFGTVLVAHPCLPMSKVAGVLTPEHGRRGQARSSLSAPVSRVEFCSCKRTLTQSLNIVGLPGRQ